jgi:hypothetical protein
MRRGIDGIAIGLPLLLEKYAVFTVQRHVRIAVRGLGSDLHLTPSNTAV